MYYKSLGKTTSLNTASPSASSDNSYVANTAPTITSHNKIVTAFKLKLVPNQEVQSKAFVIHGSAWAIKYDIPNGANLSVYVHAKDGNQIGAFGNNKSFIHQFPQNKKVETYTFTASADKPGTYGFTVYITNN